MGTEALRSSCVRNAVNSAQTAAGCSACKTLELYRVRPQGSRAQGSRRIQNWRSSHRQDDVSPSRCPSRFHHRAPCWLEGGRECSLATVQNSVRWWSRLRVACRMRTVEHDRGCFRRVGGSSFPCRRTNGDNVGVQPLHRAALVASSRYRSASSRGTVPTASAPNAGPYFASLNRSDLGFIVLLLEPAGCFLASHKPP